MNKITNKQKVTIHSKVRNMSSNNPTTDQPPANPPPQGASGGSVAPNLGTNPQSTSSAGAGVGGTSTAATGGGGQLPSPTATSTTTTGASSGAVKSPAAASVTDDPTDKAVLEYLRKKGMGTAALELSEILKQRKPGASAADNEKAAALAKEQMEEEERKSILTKATGGGYGYDRDAAAPVVQWGVPDKTTTNFSSKDSLSDRMGVDEARALLDAFTSFQLWVLSLPDHDGFQQATENPILKAQQLIQNNKGLSLASVVESMVQKPSSSQENYSKEHDSIEASYHLPPSAKPELFAISFALLVHTYCELLEVGMESTAHVLRDTFKCVYEPLYAKEFADLFQCNTTEDMMRLNSHNAQHMEALANLKGILVQIAQYQLKRDELRKAAASAGSSEDSSNQAAKHAKLQEYERAVTMLQQKYNDLSQRASMAFNKMHDLPFLRRARAVRWQLFMSTASYGLLSSFLNAQDTSLLAMSTLLQTKCELHVERRDPLPFTPACVLDDNMNRNAERTLALNQTQVSWAAPMPRQKIEFSKGEKLPFPKFHLDKEYDDERKAKRDKQLVQFNRSLLVNGFRRLEALERKTEYETLPRMKVAKEDYHHHASSRGMADPLEPSILLSTLCSNSSGPTLKPTPTSSSHRNTFVDSSALWEESGIGLCCAEICPPDGRQVAVGCDDAAVRIWNLMEGDKGKEPSQVLLGHKNGFPVFDVSWNRDGRSLLSAGGDGSVRLWDTRAVGYFGENATIKPGKKSSSSGPKNTSLEDMNVPGLKSEDSEFVGGAALAVYRGHAPSTPIWSVAFAPCGYYFASAGADATVRLWTTDREVPVRLFTGHTSMIVNCVDWHPNCNYIITGSEDKTARLWDIHSGRTVRLLNGCSSGINIVRISPCGKYAAGGDSSGTTHLWDLSTGKKVTELRPKKVEKDHRDLGSSMIHAMSFSACGSGLATGGDDGCVRVWDVRQESISKLPVVESPMKSFATRQTLILDMKYNKRNLLLSVGKYATPVPAPVAITD